MIESWNVSRAVQVLLLTATVLGVAASAGADTIYLKNGRVIRTSEVRVEGDKVFFRQYAGTVVIPMAIVDRIEEDEMGGPSATAATPPTSPADESAGTEEGAESGQAEQAEDVPPEQTREYWQERVSANRAERQEVEERLERLRREERAFLFSQRSTAETRRQIEDAQERLQGLQQELEQIQEEARRAGVPPGWLRVEQGSGDGGTSGDNGTFGGTSGQDGILV